MAKAAKKRSKAKQPKSRKGLKGRNTSGLVPWKKGQPGLGRPKGVKNKLGVLIKEAITEAIARSGRDGKGKDGAVGYFVWLSRAEPAVFGGLIGKVMPLQINVKDKTERMSPSEAIEHLKERGLPVPDSLNSLAATVGRAHAEREEEDYEAELNGEGDGEVEEDNDNNEEGQEDAA